MRKPGILDLDFLIIPDTYNVSSNQKTRHCSVLQSLSIGKPLTKDTDTYRQRNINHVVRKLAYLPGQNLWLGRALVPLS